MLNVPRRHVVRESRDRGRVVEPRSARRVLPAPPLIQGGQVGDDQRRLPEQFQLQPPAEQRQGLVVAGDVGCGFFLQVGVRRVKLVGRQFNPLDGVSVMNSAGEETALGLAFHPVGVSAGGGSNGSSDNSALNLECQSGGDGKLGVLDSCPGFIGGNSFSGHVVDCKDAPQIP